jgi:type VI secretion system protein ImpJ
MLRKPHWTLGLELAPHHFQFQDAYHEELIARRFDALFDYAWGIYEMEWDTRVIAAGELALRRFEAIFPDGTPVSIGGSDGAATPALTLGDFGARGSLDVHVGFPRLLAGANVAVDGHGGQPRYVRESSLVPDFASGTEPIRVEWLRPNVQILLAGDSLQEFMTLPAARIIRTPAGDLAFDETFVPPVLSVKASSYLQRELRELLSTMVARQAAMKGRQRRDAAEAVQRWIASILGSFVLRIADLVQQSRVHPLFAYQTLAELLGALAAFTRDGQHTVPRFDYDHLGATFAGLFRNLEAVLDALGAEQHRRIPLQRYDPTTFFAELNEPAIFRNDFYVGVGGSDLETLHRQVPHTFKVAAWNELPSAVSAATPAVPLKLVATPPATLPDANGVAYFKLEKNAAFSSIFKTGQIGIYHVSGLPVTNVALFAVDPDAT